MLRSHARKSTDILVRKKKWNSDYGDDITYYFYARARRQKGSPLGQCSYLWSLATVYLDTQGPQAAKDASACQDKLIDIFKRIGHFFQQLNIYTTITPTAGMTDIIVEIIVEVINILAIATKEVKMDDSVSRCRICLPFLAQIICRIVVEEVNGKLRHRR